MGGLDEWLPPALLQSRAGTETGLQIAQVCQFCEGALRFFGRGCVTDQSCLPQKMLTLVAGLRAEQRCARTLT